MQVLESRWFLFLSLGLLAVLFAFTQVEYRSDPRPTGSPADIRSLSERSDTNLLFILVDTLRADHLGSYGYERDTSPFLDYLALKGVRFDSHFAQTSWTKSSMASLWTGLYPARSGIHRSTDGLPEEARLPTEIFQDAGFVTMGIYRNGWVAPNFGFDQGFDIYQSPLVNQMPDTLMPNVRAGRIAGTDIDSIFSAVDFLRTHQDQRFLMYIHMMDLHQYVSDQESAIFGNTYKDSYDNSIRWVDRQIQTLVGELERLGLRNKTLIVIASDHGEAFGEHGSEGHAKDIHAEVITTPWIMSFPFQLDDQVVYDTSANVDLWPTILDLFGLEGMPGIDGRSRVGELSGTNGSENAASERFAFAHFDKNWSSVTKEPDPFVSVRDDRYRLIRDKEKARLYDLEEDSGEQRDISDREPKVRAKLEAELDRYLDQEIYFEAGVPSVTLGEMELRHLRALGYEINQ